MKVYFEATVYDGAVTIKRPNGMLVENVTAIAKGQPWKSKATNQWTVFIPCYNEKGELIGQLGAKSTEVRLSSRGAQAPVVVEQTA